MWVKCYEGIIQIQDALNVQVRNAIKGRFYFEDYSDTDPKIKSPILTSNLTNAPHNYT